MDGRAGVTDVLRLKGLLEECRARVEALLTMPEASEEERQILAAAATLADRVSRRSLDDGLRWVKAFQAGDEAWLVIHAKDGRCDIRYHGSLSREQRAVLGR